MKFEQIPLALRKNHPVTAGPVEEARLFFPKIIL
jgi:hypothetical protein